MSICLDTAKFGFSIGVNSALHRAAFDGNVNKLIELLDVEEMDVDAPGYGDLTALHFAVLKNHVHIVTELIKRGADLDQAALKVYPLNLAISLNQVPMTKLLIENNADIFQAIDKDSNSALHHAALVGNCELILMTECSLNVDIMNANGETPLMHACSNGHFDAVKLLIEKQARVDVRNRSSGSPILLEAVLKRRDNVIEMLLDANANVNDVDRIGTCSLYQSCSMGNVSIVRLLLERNANIQLSNWEGNSPLHAAVLHGKCEELIELLLQNGASWNKRNTQGLRPFDLVSPASPITEMMRNIEKNGLETIFLTKNAK